MIANLILPNVLIAGAPKCGTTSLFRYLADHPDVCASTVKEARYLLDADFPLFNPENNFLRYGLSGYSRFFSEEEARSRSVILEATPDYIYQNTPHRALKEFPTPPFVIFVFRRPATRILSQFNYVQNNLAQLPKDWSFKSLVDHLLADTVPSKYPLLRESIRQSRYADYLQYWVDTVGRNHIIVLLFEELVQNPLLVMQDLARRIGLDPSFYETYGFPKENPTILIRNQALHRIFRSLWGIKMPQPIRRLGGAMYRALNVSKRGHAQRKDEQAQLQRLDREFVDSNKRLTALTGLDLSCWDDQSISNSAKVR
ncbi:MAG: hypothetical protein A2W25_00960 [candidate division Zixibacteria bacterium RBG_16_53_22]|nr:MAG: hypothetical protein A2W25_00960 [candidate division Zixibacteria bacterium RBG_16_53_22]